jgi:MSHA biogenesis protein MshO
MRTVRGVSLVELVVVIVITAILGAIIVSFVAPVRSYIDSSRRAALADAADIALRRIGRDVRLALPNSTRVTSAGSAFYLEFMLVRTGGRYRTDTGSGAGNCPGGASDDILSFGVADACFRTLGAIPNRSEVVGNSDYVVVYNLQPGTSSADAYAVVGTGGNKSLVSSATAGAGGEDKVQFASNTFTYESPGNRFFIIEGPVSYICDPVAGTVTRRWGYTWSTGTTATTSFTDGSNALMASGVTGCSFTYEASLTSQGAGLVTLRLQLTTTDSRGSTETATLYHAVHVNNIP